MRNCAVVDSLETRPWVRRAKLIKHHASLREVVLDGFRLRVSPEFGTN